ncbi:metal-dependent transcriptional regulator, partial [Halobium palmae]
LYLADRRGNTPTSSGFVADRLGRSPSAATEMLQRLAAEGLVTREPYEGAKLTPEGRESAEELYETYRVLSQFFRDVLDLDAHEEEAIRLTGNVSATVVERLAATILDAEAPSESTGGAGRAADGDR